MPPVAWKAYNDASEKYFHVYEGLQFSRMHRAFSRFLPPIGSACLDVGAGSGRDAVALARRGYKVTAVEPSIGMRRLAEKYHSNSNITWIGDALPRLAKVLAMSQRFRFILLSAVWMHIPPHQRVQSLKSLNQLLEVDGCIAMTLRLGTPSEERVMFAISVEELLAHALQAGLVPLYVSRRTRDSLRREDIEWRKVVLCKTEAYYWLAKRNPVVSFGS